MKPEPGAGSGGESASVDEASIFDLLWHRDFVIRVAGSVLLSPDK